MGNSLLQALQHELEEVFQEHSIAVWYDLGGTLSALVEKAVPQNVHLLRFERAYLPLRVKLEETDPFLEKRWLIYIPAESRKPSWLRDYELAGRRLDLTLADLLSRAFDIPVNRRMREILSTPAAKRLVERWENLLGSTLPITFRQVKYALLAAALDATSTAPRDLILSYVTREDAHVSLRENGLLPEFRRFLDDQGFVVASAHLPLFPGDVSPLKVAAALLFSEAVVNGRLNTAGLEDVLPREENRSQWASWAMEWLRHRDDEILPQMVREVQEAYQIEERLSGLDIAGIQGFPAVDEVLVRELEALLKTGLSPEILDEVERIAKLRANTRWARESADMTAPLPWKASLAAVEILKAVPDVSKKLSQKGQWSLKDLFDQYAEGWWHLDDAYRRLEAYWDSLGVLEEPLGLPAARAYEEFLNVLARKVATALENTHSWQIPDWLPQSRVLEDEVIPQAEETALLLADGLRYDLAIALARRLRENGIEVEERRTLASLPSIGILVEQGAHPFER